MTDKSGKWWVTLYDSDNRQIARYKVAGSATIDNLLISWSLNHPNIEYVRITTRQSVIPA